VRGRDYLLIAAIAIAATISCKKEAKIPTTSDENILAKVGDYNITVQDLERDFPKYGEGLITPEAAYKARRSYLDDMVAKKLLTMEAKQRGLGTDYDIATDMEMIEETALVQALYDMLIIDKLITDDQLKQDYDTRYKQDNKVEFKIRHILVSRINEAREVMDKIKAGGDFSALAKQYSIDKSKIRGGEMDWMTMDSAPVRNLAEEAIKLDPGVYGTIIQSRFGYHVYQLIDKREYQIPPFEQVRADIRRRLSYVHADSITALAKIHIDSLRLAYHVQMVPDVFDLLTLRVRENKPAPTFSETTIQSASNIPEFTPEEKEKILFLFDGGKFTLNDYQKRVKYYHPVKQPKGDDLEHLKEVSNNMVNALILGNEARSMKLDTLSSVKDYLEMRKNSFDQALDKSAVEQLIQIEVKNKVSLEPGETRQFFDENLERYVDSAGQAPQFETVEEKVLADLIAKKEEILKVQLVEHLKTIYPVLVYEQNFEKAFKGKP
jgi:peptidyl-prolyl cis-trans isomerase C